MDCTSGTLARTCARSEFLAVPEEAASAVNACTADGNATPTRLGLLKGSLRDECLRVEKKWARDSFEVILTERFVCLVGQNLNEVSGGERFGVIANIWRPDRDDF
jgi:hypothetical protein